MLKQREHAANGVFTLFQHCSNQVLFTWLTSKGLNTVLQVKYILSLSDRRSAGTVDELYKHGVEDNNIFHPYSYNASHVGKKQCGNNADVTLSLF